MGWNDHVEFYQTECLECGEIDIWEYCDSTGRQRYVGRIGEFLNVDAGRSGKCQSCGSTNGCVLNEEEAD